MIKTRIYLTSGSHVDVQEPFNEVNYVMMHSAPTWTFTLKTESGEPVCVARDHVAYFTTCDDGQQKTEQAFTYLEFIKAFNEISLVHHACESSYGGVAIFDSPHVPCQKMASLGLESRNSAQSEYTGQQGGYIQQQGDQPQYGQQVPQGKNFGQQGDNFGQSWSQGDVNVSQSDLPF